MVVGQLRASRNLEAFDRFHHVQAKTLIEDVVVPHRLELGARNKVVLPLFECRGSGVFAAGMHLRYGHQYPLKR